jgi:hypothetical protein
VIGDNQAITYQWLLNGATAPTMPVRSFPEAWTQLTKALGQHNSTMHPIGITPLEYQTTSFMIAQDYETVLQAGFTGQNLRNNSQLSVQLSNMDLNGTISSSSTDALRRAYLLLMYDVVVQIGDAGIEIMD